MLLNLFNIPLAWCDKRFLQKHNVFGLKGLPDLTLALWKTCPLINSKNGDDWCHDNYDQARDQLNQGGLRSFRVSQPFWNPSHTTFHSFLAPQSPHRSGENSVYHHGESRSRAGLAALTPRWVMRKCTWVGTSLQRLQWQPSETLAPRETFQMSLLLVRIVARSKHTGPSLAAAALSWGKYCLTNRTSSLSWTWRGWS